MNNTLIFKFVLYSSSGANCNIIILVFWIQTEDIVHTELEQCVLLAGLCFKKKKGCCESYEAVLLPDKGKLCSLLIWPEYKFLVLHNNNSK